MKYISSKIPATFHFQKNEKALRKEFDAFWKNVIHLKTHSPFLFVDHSSVDLLPEPSFLAKFKIVLTTTKRFSYEWKSGSFESEIRQTDKTDDLDGNLTSELSACSLLKINWTRLVVDEGHSMGRSKHNNAILFASWITASRRWAMTGTPTPQTSSSSGLSNLMGLMGFLKHDFFTPKLDGERFWNSLVRSWNTGSLSAFFQVRSLLSIFMKRHRKLDIPELPPPIFKRVWLDMSIGEKSTFNTLASAVQSNILITGMRAKTSGKQDSLLHKSQSKHARRAFENLRLVCSGGLRVVPQITREAWDETIELLNHHELDNVKMKLILDFMERAVTEQLSHCMACGIGLNTLLIVPCGDLVCTDCMKDNLQVASKNCTKVRSGNALSDYDKDFIQVCPICQAEFDADEFQRLQPGIIYEWYDYGKHEEKLKKEMLLDQIEEAGQAEVNLGLAGQVEIQPAVPIRRTRKQGDGHVCTYSKSNGDGRCKYCHEEHDGCVMILENSRCTTCHRVAENCPREESKFHYIISKLDFLQSQVRQKSRSYSPAASSIIGEEIKTEEVRPLKVIIFSQYRKVLNLIGNRLIRRYGPGAISEFWGSYRRKELLKFKNISDCFCMLLSKDGSEGLDISFVTHIFFLEEIWDKSLQDQTVARAWRMGATGRVEVETLLANESVESLMAINDDEGCDSFQRNISEIKRSKMNHILESLRLIGRPSRALKREVDEHIDTSIPKKKHMVRFRDSA
jgi:SNF2 family DNA or RNA helicase